MIHHMATCEGVVAVTSQHVLFEMSNHAAGNTLQGFLRWNTFVYLGI